MVRTIDNNNKEADRITSQLFLSSINTWYKKSGVECGVESIGKVFTTKFSTDPQIPIKMSILDDMPKCRARKIDENGKVVSSYDEVADRDVAEVEIINDADAVTFFMRMKNVEDSDIDDVEYMISNRSSAFPLFNYGFISSGLLPEDNDKTFIATYEEIKECLEGLEFIANVEKREFKGNQYNVLLAEAKEE